MHYNKSAFKSVVSYCRSIIKEADELYKNGGDGIQKGLRLFSDKLPILNAVQKKSTEYSDFDNDASEICISLATDAVLCLAHTADIKTQIRWHREAFNAAKRLNKPRDVIFAGNNLGASLIKNKNESEAIQTLKECLEISEAIGFIEHRFRTLNNMGVAYKNLRDFSNAIECYEKKLDILEQYPENVLEKISAIGNLGIVYKEKGEYETALEYHNKRLRLARKEKNYSFICRAYGDIGITYFNMKKTKKAIEFFKKQLEIARKYNFHDSERKARWGQCQALHLKGDINNAILIGKETLRLYEKYNDPFSAEIQKHLIDWMNGDGK